MNAFSPDRVLSREVRSRLQYHYRTYGPCLQEFRLATQRTFEDEVDRLCRSFAEGSLESQAGPVVEALRSYLTWLGWCAWCSSHLAPPLGLTKSKDVRRFCAALVVYCGPRIIDDAVDGHYRYKGKHETSLAFLASTYADRDAGCLRAHSALIGAWIIIYGLRRLKRHGGHCAAEATLRFCQRIAPGAVLENLHAHSLDWQQYQQIVHRKSVLYDQILYRSLLDPVPKAQRTRLLAITARISALAQYLNDFTDRHEDGRNRRDSVYRRFSDDTEFWNLCREHTDAIVAELESLPDRLGNAVAAALVETVDAAARITPPRTGQLNVSDTPHFGRTGGQRAEEESRISD